MDKPNVISCAPMSNVKQKQCRVCLCTVSATIPSDFIEITSPLPKMEENSEIITYLDCFNKVSDLELTPEMLSINVDENNDARFLCRICKTKLLDAFGYIMKAHKSNELLRKEVDSRRNANSGKATTEPEPDVYDVGLELIELLERDIGKPISMQEQQILLETKQSLEEELDKIFEKPIDMEPAELLKELLPELLETTPNINTNDCKTQQTEYAAATNGAEASIENFDINNLLENVTPLNEDIENYNRGIQYNNNNQHNNAEVSTNEILKPKKSDNEPKKEIVNKGGEGGEDNKSLQRNRKLYNFKCFWCRAKFILESELNNHLLSNHLRPPPKRS